MWAIQGLMPSICQSKLVTVPAHIKKISCYRMMSTRHVENMMIIHYIWWAIGYINIIPQCYWYVALFWLFTWPPYGAHVWCAPIIANSLVPWHSFTGFFPHMSVWLVPWSSFTRIFCMAMRLEPWICYFPLDLHHLHFISRSLSCCYHCQDDKVILLVII